VSIIDAYVHIMCNQCQDEEEVDLPFVYMNQFGGGGHYDHRKPRLPRGWVKTGEDEHLCEDCAAARDERLMAKGGGDGET